MTINCYQINTERQLTPCDYNRAIEMLQDSASRIWFDVQGAETDRLEALLDKLEVKDLACRLCVEARERPGFYPLNAFILMVIPVQGDEAHMREVEYITVLCRQNLLLTVRDERDSPLQQIATIHESADWLTNESIAGLVSTIMMVLSLDSLQILSELREKITELEKRLDRDPDLVEIKEISGKRSKLLTLEAVVSGQLPSLKALMATDKPFFRLDTAREYLVSALANLEAADRSLHWLEGRLDVVRSEYEMRSQDKMNRRLSRLTILSTIFMPITFLAGVWGMNFDHMPALSHPYGYVMALGTMTFIGAGMFLYFRRKGWFE